MPMKAPYVCGSCGRTVQAGKQCACKKAAAKDRKARHDARRPSARQRGYTAEWEKARLAYLSVYPSCWRCGAPATLVDHVTPHRGDKAIFWDRRNWQPLCVHCHSGAKQSEERRSNKKEMNP
ncbi:MAG: HNH endonuclease [Hyphomicrobiaceae bacterium]|nr:HNH endonuclease [Hyphomicrobiaceae bacterium]